VRREYYQIPEEMTKMRKIIESEKDDSKREELVASAFADHGNLDCFLPHAEPERPAGTDEYLELKPDKQKEVANTKEVFKIRSYIAKASRLVRENESNAYFVANVLLPAYERIGSEEYVCRCRDILSEHNRPQTMSLDKAEQTFRSEWFS